MIDSCSDVDCHIYGTMKAPENKCWPITGIGLPDLTEKISSTFEIDRFKIKIKIVESHVICVAVGNPAEIKVSQTISMIIIGNKAKCMWLTFKKKKNDYVLCFLFFAKKAWFIFYFIFNKEDSYTT